MKPIDATEQAAGLQIDESVEIDTGNPEQPIVLCRTEQGLFAVSGICTHAFARMAEGYLMDQYLECPLHQAQFDVTSGERVSGPECDNLSTYAVREQDGKVEISPKKVTAAGDGRFDQVRQVGSRLSSSRKAAGHSGN